MKKLLTLMLVATMFPTSALAYNASYFDNLLNISGRLRSGDMLISVQNSQGKKSLIRSEDNPKYNSYLSMFNRRVEKNMKAMRRISRCSLTPQACVARESVKVQNDRLYNRY